MAPRRPRRTPGVPRSAVTTSIRRCRHLEQKNSATDRTVVRARRRHIFRDHPSFNAAFWGLAGAAHVRNRGERVGCAWDAVCKAGRTGWNGGTLIVINNSVLTTSVVASDRRHASISQYVIEQTVHRLGGVTSPTSNIATDQNKRCGHVRHKIHERQMC